MTDFLHDLLTLPSVLNAFLSPDGHWVAFEWQRRHENLDVFLVPTDGSAPPRALSNTVEATSLVSWAPDSRTVLVQEDEGGNERARLFRINLEQPGVLIPLTEANPPYFLRGGNISPEGKFLIYGVNYDFGRQAPVAPTWIYRHDLDNGQRTPIARPVQPGYTIPQLNLQGTQVLYARKDRHPSGRQFYLVDVDGRQDREILNFGDEVKTFARWLPDGEHILVISDSRGTPEPGEPAYTRLGLYHWPTDTLRWLLDDPQRNIESAWASPDGLIVVDEMVGASHRPTFIDLHTGQETRFPALPGNLLPLGRAADGAWIGMYYSAVQPTELVRFTLDAREPADLHSLTRVWDFTALDPACLVPAESFEWNAVDGQRIQGWLYRASANPGRAVILIHGGPSSHAENRLNPIVQYLVGQGFNLLDVNYRGSTGFGLAFRELIKEDGWGGREQEDIAAGARALIAGGLAQPGRVGVVGTSYGGYSAWCQITHYPKEVIAAAAPVCGMTDLVVDYYTTRPDLRPLSEEMLGGTPETAAQTYFARSPINFIENIQGRVLIVQGARDPNVTPDNVHQVVQRLEAHHIPYELLVYEDEGHGIKKPANQSSLFPRLAAFFQEALG